jgi:hypothetical protein
VNFIQVKESLTAQKILEKAVFFAEQVHDLDNGYSTRQHFCHTGTITKTDAAEPGLGTILSYLRMEGNGAT